MAKWIVVKQKAINVDAIAVVERTGRGANLFLIGQSKSETFVEESQIAELASFGVTLPDPPAPSTGNVKTFSGDDPDDDQ